MKRIDAFKNACPSCGAEPLEPCRSPNGTSRRSAHRERARTILPIVSVRAETKPRPERPSGDLMALHIINEAADRARSAVIDQWEVVSAQCGSPIERILLARLIMDSPSREEGLHFNFYRTPAAYPDLIPHPFGGVDVHLQAQVGIYRADFLFTQQSRLNPAKDRHLLVECDGHFYHERTRAQAKHDKRRDRYFASLGITVLRFTGSEIYTDVAAVVAEIIEHLSRIADEMPL